MQGSLENEYDINQLWAYPSMLRNTNDHCVMFHLAVSYIDQLISRSTHMASQLATAVHELISPLDPDGLIVSQPHTEEH